MLEIRWHGRGGQGAKTVSQVLAQAALDEGHFVQSFPEYGPERSGAPVKAFNRIDKEKIKIHYNIYEPDVVVVIDNSLLNSKAVNVTEGLKADGVLLVNTEESLSQVKGKVGFQGRVLIVDANKIAQETGSRFANVPVLGALTKAINFPLEPIEKELKKTLTKKFADKVVEANLEALKRGYEDVISS